jgi:hypothetical protein
MKLLPRTLFFSILPVMPLAWAQSAPTIRRFAIPLVDVLTKIDPTFKNETSGIYTEASRGKSRPKDALAKAVRISQSQSNTGLRSGPDRK